LEEEEENGYLAKGKTHRKPSLVNKKTANGRKRGVYPRVGTRRSGPRERTDWDRWGCKTSQQWPKKIQGKMEAHREQAFVILRPKASQGKAGRRNKRSITRGWVLPPASSLKRKKEPPDQSQRDQ